MFIVQLQSRNAYNPRVSRDSGMLICVKLLHDWNARSFMVFKPFGRFNAPFIAEQPLNADSPIETNAVGSSSAAIEEQNANAEYPIVST
jgi:hypothetical protein